MLLAAVLVMVIASSAVVVVVADVVGNMAAVGIVAVAVAGYDIGAAAAAAHPRPFAPSRAPHRCRRPSSAAT